MSNASIGVIKAGWLHRQSDFLRRWKKQWFTLSQDGIIKYFENEHSSCAEDAARMKVDCLSVKTGNDILNVNPPEGLGRSCMISLVFRNKTWHLCAESPDDMEAWKITLEESRMIHNNPNPVVHQTVMANPPPYNAPYQATNSPYPVQTTAVAYPGQVYYGSHAPPYVVQQPNQPTHTTVIVQGHPHYYHRRGRCCRRPLWGPVYW